MITIKNMQMPDNCGECKLMVDQWCYALDADDQRGCAVRYDHRPDWCPLVEIPEDCDTCEYGGETWDSGMCDGCCVEHSNWELKKQGELKMNKVTINGITYVPETYAHVMAEKLDGMPYCMVRTYSAGVFAGYVAHQDGKEVLLKKARRIWYWDGAASLSQLAMEGTSKPENCKFPCEVDEVILTEAIEIIPITEKAKKSIAEVPVWEV